MQRIFTQYLAKGATMYLSPFKGTVYKKRREILESRDWEMNGI